MLKATKFAPLLLLAVLFGCGEGDGGGGGSAPVINSFSANPATIAAAGQTVQLRWSVSGNPTGLSIDNGVGTVSGNSVNVTPSATTIYTLTATNGSGDDTETTTVTVGGTLPGPGVEDGLPPSGDFGVSLTQTGPFQNDADGNITSASDPRVITVAPGGTFYASVSYTDPGGISAISVRIANSSPAGFGADLTPGTAVNGFTLGAEVTGCVLDGTQTSVTCVYPIAVAAGTPNITSLTPDEFAYVFRTNVTDAAGNRSDTPPRGYVVVGSGGGSTTGGSTTGGSTTGGSTNGGSTTGGSTTGGSTTGGSTTGGSTGGSTTGGSTTGGSTTGGSTTGGSTTGGTTTGGSTTGGSTTGGTTGGTSTGGSTTGGSTTGGGTTGGGTTGTIVEAPEVESFGADDSVIATGEETVLRWTLSGGSSDFSLILNDVTNQELVVTGRTNITVSPDETTAYTLFVDNDSGGDDQNTVITVTSGSTGRSVTGGITSTTTGSQE